MLVSTCALAVLVPRLADACGASVPELYEAIPADGATYPGNAALLFTGFEISLDAVTVTVDGQPAAFAPAEFAADLATIAVLVEPAPQAGQTVVVSGSFCAEEEFCEPVAITYTAGEHDVAAPAPIVEASFYAVLDHEEFSWNDSCDEWAVAQTMYVHLQQAAPGPADAPVAVHLAWDPDGAEGPAGFAEQRWAPGEATVLDVMLSEAAFGEFDPRIDGCLQVTTIDTAGNAGAPFELCMACFAGADDTPITEPPDEPLWTEADAVPGSACAPAVETTGGEDPTEGEDPTAGESGEAPTSGGESGEAPTGGGESGEATESASATDSATGGEDDSDKGCACSSDPGSANGGHLMLLALAALGLRGRRRARV